MIDEDPSDEDLDRFAGEIGYCPDCGEEVWDASGSANAELLAAAAGVDTRKQNQTSSRSAGVSPVW